MPCEQMLDPSKGMWMTEGRADDREPPILRLMLRAWPLWMMPLLALEARSQDLLFDRLTTAEGLPSDEVRALFEDRDGHLWAGTVDGLARLEGTRIRVFNHDHNDSTTLAHDQVNGIAQDANGALWFATMDGLSRFNATSGTFSNHRISASGTRARQANRMQQVLAMGDSLLWLVTEAGLYRYDIRRTAFVNMQDRPPGEGPAGTVDAAGALCWDAKRRNLWAGSHKGMASWDARSDRWTDHRTSSLEPWATVSSTNIPVVRGDSLWFLRNKPYTLFAYDPERGVLHAQPDLEEHPNLFTLRSHGFDAEGGHWLGTWTHRLFHRPRNGAWREVQADPEMPGALPSARINNLMSTRAGEHWFATAAGIAVLRPGSSAMSLLPADVGGHSITALRVVGADTLLVGTAGDGVRVLDLHSGRTTRYTMDRIDDVAGSGDQANIIRAFGARHKGLMLVCTGQGMALLDPRSHELATMRLIDEAFPRARLSSFTLAERAEGALWLGTWHGGLWRCDEGTGSCQRVDTADGPYGRLPNLMILCWLTDHKGRHWVGMNNGGGLVRMENGKFRAITDKNGANIGGVVRAIAEGPDGSIWLGTHEQGIVVYDPKNASTRYLTRRDGLPGTRILALHFGRDSTLWVSTGHGFAFMPPGSDTFQAFSLPAGLSNTDANTLVEIPDGRMVFAVGENLLAYDLARKSNLIPPVPVFTGYRVNDRYLLGPPAAMELPHDRKAFTLELGTLGYHFGLRPQFRYRLSTTDTAWSELGTSTRIDLFDLPSGRHTIEVQASLDGVSWGSASAHAMVEVLPPFHATWWFRSLMASIIVGLSFIGFRMYLSARLRKQREVFEREQAVLAERMRIAGDMHDDLGAGLSALKLRSEMALRVEKDPAKREQLGSLAKTAGDLIGNMRQIIWTMNADQRSIADLVSYTTSYARGYCAENGLLAEIITDGDWPEMQLTSEQRRNTFLVVKEALHNVVKHANARMVRLVMGLADEALQVELKDDGIGLPAHTQTSVGNGLRNMRKRINALGGSLETSAGEGGKGTRIRFIVPLGTTNQGSIGANGKDEHFRTP